MSSDGARRRHGEGSIRQRPDGRWEARKTLETDQERRRVSAYGDTPREAMRKLKAKLDDAERGFMPAPEKATVGQYLARWLDDSVAPSVRPRTLQSYREIVALYVAPEIGAVRLRQLQPAHLQRLYNQLLERGRLDDGKRTGRPLSPKTVRLVHGVMSKALNQAVAWHLAPRNVASAVSAPRVRREEVTALDIDQVAALQAAARGTRWEALIKLALATGMRQGELLGLRWADVDFASGTLSVRRQLVRGGGYSEPKTSKGRRRIDLPAGTVATLREHKKAQNEARLLLGSEWEHTDAVFCTLSGYRGKKAEPGSATLPGRPLQARNVSRGFKQLLQAAGLPDVPFHALRHTAATLLLLQGEHPKVVQERLGHSNISMTLDTYSHLMPSMGRDAADRLDSLLG